MSPVYIKPERVWLRTHPDLNEKWVQDRIAEDPSILGLGDLDVRDRERRQPRSGRLDLLLADPDEPRRYEVELQLGPTDESHIIRTLEYWDIERKRYPQYEHCAVIVAEEITTRFLNVIGLFNGSVPLIALQMAAFQTGDSVFLVFTRVLDLVKRGLVDEDEIALPPASRADWEGRADKRILGIADQLIELIRTFAPGYQPNYNRRYIGLANRDGVADNFAVMAPKRKFLRLELRLDDSHELRDQVREALPEMDFDKAGGRMRIRLYPEDVDRTRELLLELLKAASRLDEDVS